MKLLWDGLAVCVFLVTREHTDCHQSPGAATPHGGNSDLLDGGRGSRGEL